RAGMAVLGAAARHPCAPPTRVRRGRRAATTPASTSGTIRTIAETATRCAVLRPLSVPRASASPPIATLPVLPWKSAVDHGPAEFPVAGRMKSAATCRPIQSSAGLIRPATIRHNPATLARFTELRGSSSGGANGHRSAAGASARLSSNGEALLLQLMLVGLE